MKSCALIACALAWLVAACGCAELPDARTGGPQRGPVSILIVSDSGEVDAQYEKDLTDAGYRVVKTPYLNILSPEYLRQFGVIVLTRLPFAGQSYQVYGERLANVDADLKMIHEYVAAGGGLVFEPAMSEFGEAYADFYNRFLSRYDVRFVALQLRDDAESGGGRLSYAAGEAVGWHPIAGGLKQVLYPINVLRWDNAYSCTPFLVGGGWTVLASGKSGSGTHQAIDNSRVGDRLTSDRNLFAIRKSGRGYIAVSAIHSYYTLTHVYSKEDSLGENHTGVIDGAVMYGQGMAAAVPPAAGAAPAPAAGVGKAPTGARPSDMGKLLDRTYRFLAANSARNGIGAGSVPLPLQAPAPTVARVLDWHKVSPPPTWQHRVIPVWVGDQAYYDELPDPAWAGELRHFKALIGPRTSCSSGKGTVKEYRDAAVKAGYSAIMFCETFEDLNKAKWDRFVKDCDANTDDSFICFPGLDIKGFQGERYLVLCARRYPDPGWLTEDGKKLKAIRMLSLGWFGHVATVHRSGRTALEPRMYKHYQAITVYTYDGEGRLVDDALHTYQWAISSDSNPIPIAAHELTSPEQVQRAAQSGYQQIMPAPTLAKAADYFRFPLNHYFSCPVRYYISEGPVLTGWSMFNKDIGKAEENRDHYRLGIKVASADPVGEVTLYDGFQVAGRWYPGQKEFETLVDGFHDQQHEYMLLGRDAKGRGVISPGIRTVTRNWRLRCGDRQNWLGSMYIYTGTPVKPFGGFSIAFKNTREGGSNWLGDGGGNPSAIYDFPFFSNHVQVMDVDMTTKYMDAEWEDVAYDARAAYAVRPTDFTDAELRTICFSPPKKKELAATIAQMSIRLKRDVEPAVNSPVYPVVAGVMGANKLLLLPGANPGDATNATVDLPVGSYAGGIVPLTPGLRLHNRSIGFPAPQPDTLTLYKGTAWQASYLVLKSGSFHWRQVQQGYEVDALAERALAEMGLRGQPPYKFELSQGRFDALAYVADFTAANGGIADRCVNDKGQELLMDVPLRIANMNPRCAAAVWRRDSPVLDYFACFEGKGMVTFNADKTVEFYAGNVATCDPALFVSVVVWNDKEAWFRVNNPTRRDITTEFATAPAVKSFKALKKTVTVKAGSSLDVTE